MTGRIYTSLFARLLANSQENERTGCWEWAGYRKRRGGYGYLTLRVDGKPRGCIAHRAMAEAVLGRKLHVDGETLEHDCTITWCVNPWHLKLATRAANTLDMNNRRHGRSRVIFKPLLDPAVWLPLDPFAPRCFPRRRTAELEEIPF
jgi:hypothetical protein